MTKAIRPIVYEWTGFYPDKDAWQILAKLLADRGILTWHCFWDEPWADWTVRLLCLEPQEELPSLGIGSRWQEVAVDVLEEQNYGILWGTVLGLFTNASEIGMTLALNDDPLPALATPAKLVHCLMNIWGYSREDEIAAYGEWSSHARMLLAMENNKDTDLLNKVATIIRKLLPKRGRFVF